MFDIYQGRDPETGEWDEGLCSEYCDGLSQAFCDSPEAARLTERGVELGGWHYSFLDFGFNYLGSAPPELTPDGVEEILFRLFPRKVSTDPDSAGEIVEELYAFWSFLQRQYGLPNAADILRILDGDAKECLEEELGNPDNFGMAKSFFMMGREAGFDMTTQEGTSQFAAFFNAMVSNSRAEASRPETVTRTQRSSHAPMSAAERKTREKLRRRKLEQVKRRR